MSELVDRATYSARAPRGRAAHATPEQIAAWEALIGAQSAVTGLMEPVLAAVGLDPSEYDVLDKLVRGTPDGLRPTELADRVRLTKSGMTRLLDRLTERGLIKRRACPSDRRGQLIALTTAGRRLLRHAAPQVLRRLRAAMCALSANDLVALKLTADRIERAVASAHAGES